MTRYNADAMMTPVDVARILNIEIEDDSPSRFLKNRILERAGFRRGNRRGCMDRDR
jgi:hypothetical protein